MASTVAKASVATAVDGCARNFLSLADSLRQSERYAEQVTSDSFLDEFDRFKLWAGNIAAHRKGRRSLEYRLRDAPQLKVQTTDLLASLSKALSSASDIVEGRRVPWDEETYTDSDSDEPEDDGFGNLQGSTELKQLYARTKSTVTSLMRLSMAMREPAPDARVRTIDKSHFEQHDMLHVQAKFPTAPPYLIERLGRAISSRRQYLTYRETHHNKLNKDIDKLGFETALTEFTTNSTEATVLEHTENVKPTNAKDDEDDNASMTSYATSVNATLRAPKIPKEASEKEYYNCPLCFGLVSIHTAEAWKRHVFQDLHPYCCTFEDCATADRLFDSRHAWFAHELQAHHTTFVCVEGCSKSFPSESEFEKHIQSSHAEFAVSRILSALLQTSATSPQWTELRSCGLCGKRMTLRMMSKHLGHHQEELALFALPTTYEDVEGDDDEDTEGSATGAQKVKEEEGDALVSGTGVESSSESSSGSGFEAENRQPDSFDTLPVPGASELALNERWLEAQGASQIREDLDSDPYHLLSSNSQQSEPHAIHSLTHSDGLGKIPPHVLHSLSSAPELSSSASTQNSSVMPRVLNSRPKPQCFEHGCNGRQFSTFSNLLQHQREKSGFAIKMKCPKCHAKFTRFADVKDHMQHDKCEARRPSEASTAADGDSSLPPSSPQGLTQDSPDRLRATSPTRSFAKEDIVREKFTKMLLRDEAERKAETRRTKVEPVSDAPVVRLGEQQMSPASDEAKQGESVGDTREDSSAEPADDEDKVAKHEKPILAQNDEQNRGTGLAYTADRELAPTSPSEEQDLDISPASLKAIEDIAGSSLDEMIIENEEVLAEANTGLERLRLRREREDTPAAQTEAPPRPSDAPLAPIKFKDAVGRKFSFPWHICKTWKGMEELIKQSFEYVEVLGPHAQEGHYDLIGPEGEIILPQVWEALVQPGWSVTMHMWPIPEESGSSSVPMPRQLDKAPRPKEKSAPGGFFAWAAGGNGRSVRHNGKRPKMEVVDPPEETLEAGSVDLQQRTGPAEGSTEDGKSGVDRPGDMAA